MLVLDFGPHEARRAELDQAGDVRRLVDMVGGIVPMDMAWQALVGLALLMGMAVLGDRSGKFRMPNDLGLRDGVGIVPGRDVRSRERHAERHREGDDEAEPGSKAAARHGQSVEPFFLTTI